MNDEVNDRFAAAAAETFAAVLPLSQRLRRIAPFFLREDERARFGVTMHMVRRNKQAEYR